jgi:hypothetical protein
MTDPVYDNPTAWDQIEAQHPASCAAGSGKHSATLSWSNLVVVSMIDHKSQIPCFEAFYEPFFNHVGQANRLIIFASCLLSPAQKVKDVEHNERLILKGVQGYVEPRHM